MSERAPYSRVYWSIVDDPKFASVFDDDRRLATWLRLLIVADQAHPASAYVPLGTNRAALTALVNCGLVDLGTGNRYRIHGLDKERSRRWGPRSGPDDPATGPTPVPNGPQVGPKSDPSGSSRAGDTRDQPSKAEQSKDEPSRDTARAPDPADVYWTLTGRYPSEKALRWVDDLTSKFGADAVIRALAQTSQTDRSANTLLGRTEDNLKADARALDLKAQAEVRHRIEERRAAPRAVVDPEALNAEIRKLLEAA